MEHSVDRGSTGGGKRTHDEMEASTTTSVRIEAAPGRSLFEQDENVNTMRSFEVEQDEDTLDAEDNEIEEVDPGSIDAPVDDQEDVPPEHEEDEAARRVEIEETLGEDNVEEPVEEERDSQ
ncbi:hypothetical protein BV25DRAFT_1188178 [Artomyces pyxidatus]|uniref:Uncharacterized protein n=1 Tax=Artomyces pyxidatus TaxID=48021 RepID=A0ACB8SR80_9AGAM|nr:hypothetical protein BV25DRAFT_1188178 [Artomyces pyxidatus]